MVAHYGIIANLNAEKPRKAKPVENPGLPVAKSRPGASRCRRGTLVERSKRCSGKRRHGLHRRCRGGRRLAWAAPSLIRCATLTLCSYRQKWTKYHNARDCQASGGKLRPGCWARAEAKRQSERTRVPNIGGRITWPRPREDETNGGCCHPILKLRRKFSFVGKRLLPPAATSLPPDRSTAPHDCSRLKRSA